MIKTNFKKFLSLFISVVLIAAVALMSYGCGDRKTQFDVGNTTSATQAPSVTELGEGKNSFSFTVTDGEGRQTPFLIKTDKTTVGDALLELKLIEGEEAQYGLYVRKVNGITADYDTDGTYWAFYIDGKYAPSGVDTTNIVNGEKYEFRVEK